MEVKLIKKPDDPICVRVSAGGTPEIGYYCVYRGDRDDVVACLRAILGALEGGAPVSVEGEGK